ncbi:hypothetical protein EJ06DRAFT_579644, partial [Trichodelitschia bisporula]
MHDAVSSPPHGPPGSENIPLPFIGLRNKPTSGGSPAAGGGLVYCLIIHKAAGKFTAYALILLVFLLAICRGILRWMSARDLYRPRSRPLARRLRRPCACAPRVQPCGPGGRLESQIDSS